MPVIVLNGASGDDVQIALVANDPTQATYNQGQLQVALSRGGYIQILDPGTYYVTSDAFSYPVNTQVFVATGVQFAIGQSVVTLNSLAPITTTPNASALVTTWSARPSAATYSARTLFVTDVGVGGSYWFSDGVKWRPIGGRVTLKNLTTEISNSGAPKIVMDSVTCPAGLISDGDIVRIEYTKQRLGGTSDTDATDIMIGTVAATLGTSTGLINSGLATTNIEIDVRAAYRKVSATSVRPVSLIGSNGYGIGTAVSVAATVPNMDTQTTYIQITSDLTTAGGEVAWLRAFTVELVAGS